MSKPEWGTKRTCQSCDTFFYDLKKDPITCPKCLTVYDEKTLLSKRNVPMEIESDIENEASIEDAQEEEDEFFLDKPSDLLESLEDLDEEFHPQQAIQI